MLSFQTRQLKITLMLSNGIVFKSTGENFLTITGLRAIANIVQAGGVQTGSADISIFGMLESDMNQLTSLSFDLIGKTQEEIFRNTVTVEADGVFCFTGTIINCFGVYSMQPDVFLHIEAVTQYFDKINPYPPSCFPGQADVATMMTGLANAMNLQLENNGINIKTESVYFAGTAMRQAADIAEHNNFDLFYEGYTMVIVPRGGSRSMPVPLISRDTGLAGYPSFDNMGVSFRTLFNPMIHFLSTVEVSCPIIRANGNWIVNSLRYTLESEKPGGAWFMDVRAAKGASYGG